MGYLIGIDDTDNKLSRGTGFRSRQLTSELVLAGFGEVCGIISHQLLQDEKISSTSSNSSNSFWVDCCDIDGLKNFCRNFLVREQQAGSNGGLCIAHEVSVTAEIEEFGRRAKREILTMEEAISLAEKHEILLEGICGNHNGIIGALAAVGLRKTGNDGRYIWQPGKQLKDLRGTMRVEDILQGTQVDDIMSKEGRILGPEEIVDLTDWVRAVIVNGKTYIIVERNLKRSGSDWKIADKGYIRKIGS